MKLEQLLGNEQLKQNLASAFRQDRISHSYLICGPEGSGKHTLARILAAAMECTAPERPCGVCPQCRKVFSGVHPDVITVDDPEHKAVSVAVIREACADLYIRPNEGRRKVYLLPRAGDLNRSSSNALLKAMEEPPDYGAFILLAPNAQNLLPTIRSRCVELQMRPLPKEVLLEALTKAFPQQPRQVLEAAFVRSGGYYGQAAALLAGADTVSPQTEASARAYAGKDRLALTMLLTPLEKWKREDFSQLLRQWLVLLQGALAMRAGAPAVSPQAEQISQSRTAAEIFHTIRCLQDAQQAVLSNVSIGTLCGALQVQLR